MNICIKCYEKTIFACLIVILVLFVILIIMFFPKYSNVHPDIPCATCDKDPKDHKTTIIVRDYDPPLFHHVPNHVVKDYDIHNLEDPLEAPTSRPPKHIFRPLYGSPLIDYPTRGRPDDYSYMGNLVRSSVLANSDDAYVQPADSILQVMGRQKFPGSSIYDYYVLLDKSHMRDVKINIKTSKNSELYDGDTLVIPELGNVEYTFTKNKSFLNQIY